MDFERLKRAAMVMEMSDNIKSNNGQLINDNITSETQVNVKKFAVEETQKNMVSSIENSNLPEAVKQMQLKNPPKTQSPKNLMVNGFDNLGDKQIPNISEEINKLKNKTYSEPIINETKNIDMNKEELIKLIDERLIKLISKYFVSEVVKQIKK